MAEQEKSEQLEEEQNQEEQQTGQASEDVEVIDSDESSEKSEDSETDALQEQIDQLKKEKQEAEDRVLRIQAEFDNYKKRTQKEKEAARKYKSEDLVTELLPALDNFERALQVEVNEATSSLVDGITMVYNQLKAALASQGVEEIETEGKEFDPTLHHAVMQAEDENFDSNIIVEELQKGYILKDKVIRPSMVKVNK
ncbi:nucleotide exchange factor GrpE [Virgibacillus xinjiangensis]|uniref:Protein GrpE n=1 Tax=Virgibacillus xinjiangensis TaxID=393090 RepID=A0ABV7CRQ8_9BACI